MGFFLLALFIFWLIVEITTLSYVAGLLGSALDAVVVLLLISLVGAWLTKRAGLGAGRRIREAQRQGRTPSGELIGGFLVLVAGVLLVAPGFVSGALGLLLLLPPVRAGVRALLVRRFRDRANMVFVKTETRSGRSSRPEVWDVDSWEDPPGSAEIEGPR